MTSPKESQASIAPLLFKVLYSLEKGEALLPVERRRSLPAGLIEPKMLEGHQGTGAPGTQQSIIYFSLLIK